MTRVAVVDGTPELLEAVRSLDLEPIFVGLHPDSTERLGGRADHAVTAHHPHGAAVAEVLTPFHAQEPLCRVMSLTEAGLLPAAEASDRLGIAGNTARTVALMQDKVSMRALLDKHGPSPVLAREVRSADELGAFCAMVRGPVILKPVDGTGSTAIHRVDAESDADQAWSAFAAQGLHRGIAEEFLKGREISVESFSAQGLHTIICATEKTLFHGFVESGHSLPAVLSGTEEREVRELLGSFLDVVGLREGPAHTELMLTAAGPRLIESHPRIGGDKIRVLVKHAFDLDLVELTVACVTASASPPRSPQPRGGAAIRFLAPTPGVVTEVRLPPAQEGATTTLSTYAHLWPTAEDKTRAAASGMASAVLATQLEAQEGGVTRSRQ